MDKNKIMIGVGIAVIVIAIVVFVAVYLGTTSNPTGKVKFRTSSLTYNHVFETDSSSIAYTSVNGNELSVYGLASYDAYVCDQMPSLKYLYPLPGTLDGQSVKLYSFTTSEGGIHHQLFVCSGNSAVVYKLSTSGQVETSSDSIDPTREVFW